MPLTPQQSLFVAEYLKDLNATQAAIRAGYSAKTANEQGCRLLTNVSVAEAVAEAMKKRIERTEISADRVLKEFARMGFVNMASFLKVDENGLPIADFSALSEDDWAAVQELTITENVMMGSEDNAVLNRKVKFKLHAKDASLTQIGRHLGMFTDKTEHSFADLTDEQRVERLIALADAARARRDGSADPKSNG